jgi:hypothetical protein
MRDFFQLVWRPDGTGGNGRGGKGRLEQIDGAEPLVGCTMVAVSNFSNETKESLAG